MNAVTDDLTLVPLPTLLAAAQDAPGDNSPAMNEIVRRFQGHAVRLAQQVTQQRATQDDATQAALLALVTAVRKHDRRAAGFTSYARRYMLGAAHTELQAWAKGSTAASVDSDEGQEAVSVVPAPVPVAGQLTWGYGPAARLVAMMPATQQELLRRRYIEDATLGEIAERAGTSIPAVSQRLSTAHRAIAARMAA